MTSADIKYALAFVGYDDSIENPVPLEGIRNFNENRFIDAGRNRYKFDFDNEVLNVYFCKDIGRVGEITIPADWVLYKNYDIYKDHVYKYMCDFNDEPIFDCIDFDSIDVIGIFDEDED